MIHRTTIPIQLLFIEDDGYHLLIKVKLNGKGATMLIDTGASRTVFDRSRMLRYAEERDFLSIDKLSTGLGTNKMETHSTWIKNFRIGKLSLQHFETILLDLSHVNNSYARLDLPAIDGVLGSDLMMKYEAVIDYRAKEMKLRWRK